jgi:uncharacterized membrane protein
MNLEPIIDDIGRALDAVGVLAIVIGVAVATLAAVRALLRERDGTVYDTYRQRLGRSILLGLELLVAADIIETVAGDPTFESVGILGLIVLIRTFLSYTLEVELTGRWPWQPADKEHEDSSHGSAV